MDATMPRTAYQQEADMIFKFIEIVVTRKGRCGWVEVLAFGSALGERRALLYLEWTKPTPAFPKRLFWLELFWIHIK